METVLLFRVYEASVIVLTPACRQAGMEREMSIIKEYLRLPPLQIDGEEVRW